MNHNAMKIVVVFLAGFGLASFARAEYFYLNGNDLYKKCTATGAETIASCKAYLIGVLDGRVTYMFERSLISDEKLPIGICIYERKDKTIEDLRQAVIRQIEGNHERYDGSQGGIAVVEAINKTFPCDNGVNNGALIRKNQRL